MELTIEKVTANIKEIKKFRDGKLCLREWNNALSGRSYSKYRLIDLYAMIYVIERRDDMNLNSILGQTIVLYQKESDKRKN